MNLNQFTIKSQEAVQKAAQKTAALGQQSIETPHLFMGLWEAGEQTLSFIQQMRCSTSDCCTGC